MAGQQVMFKVGAYDIDILDSNSNFIVTHSRLYVEEKESMSWGPYLELMSKETHIVRFTTNI